MSGGFEIDEKRYGSQPRFEDFSLMNSFKVGWNRRAREGSEGRTVPIHRLQV